MFFVLLAVFWLLGIWFVGTVAGGAIPLTMWAFAAALCLPVAVWIRKQESSASLVLACLCLFCAGGLRARLAEPQLSDQHIIHLNDSPRTMTLTGQVIDEPDVRDRVVNLRVRVDSASQRSLEHPQGLTQAVEGVVLVSSLRFPVIAYGTQVTVTGKLQTPFESAEFSYKDYLALEGIYSTMYWPRVAVSAENHGNPFFTTLYQIKSDANATIDRIIPAPESAVLQALLFGDRTFLSDGLLEDFRTDGLAHTIVVSGFHISIILVLVLNIAQLVTTPPRAVLLAAGFLLGYVLLVGWSPSVVRAAAMGIAYLIGEGLLGRRGASVSILALVAILLTLIDPLQLYSVSFQLSFMATLGIILYSRPIGEWITDRLHFHLGDATTNRYLGRLISILAMTIGAQILTLPLVAWHFEQVSLISLVANLLVTPVLPLIMIWGGFATLLGLAFEPLGQFVGWGAWLPLNYVVNTVELLARVPLASVPVRVSAYSVGLTYALIGLVTWYRAQEVDRQIEIWDSVAINFSQKAVSTVGVVGTMLIMSWHNSQPDGMLHVTFFDVGQGDATLIESPSGRQILIDAGYFPSVINAHLGRSIPFWDRTIDMVIATHPDADHITGIPEVFDRYDVDTLLIDGTLDDVSPLYDEVLIKAKETGVTVKNARAGQVIALGDGLRLEIVHPGRELDDEVRNNNSISMRLIYGDFSLLLTGDVEASAETEILSHNYPLQSVVYKAGHHGSKTSSTPAFLDAIQPQIVVVSAGEENRFNHPHPEVIQRFADYGATVLSTIDLGSIEVITDGKQMWWEAVKK